MMTISRVRDIFKRHDDVLCTSAGFESLKSLIILVFLWFGAMHIRSIDGATSLSAETLLVFMGMVNGAFYYYAVISSICLVGFAFPSISPWRHILSTIVMVMGTIYWIGTSAKASLEVSYAGGLAIVLFLACAVQFVTILEILTRDSIKNLVAAIKARAAN